MGVFKCFSDLPSRLRKGPPSHDDINLTYDLWRVRRHRSRRRRHAIPKNVRVANRTGRAAQNRDGIEQKQKLVLKI